MSTIVPEVCPSCGGVLVVCKAIIAEDGKTLPEVIKTSDFCTASWCLKCGTIYTRHEDNCPAKKLGYPKLNKMIKEEFPLLIVLALAVALIFFILLMLALF